MYNVGDIVFVPNAVEWVWDACYTQIKRISEDNGKITYYADCPHHNLFSISPGNGIENVERSFKEHEVFNDLNECKKYISDYYYGGLCKNCHYNDRAGQVWRCGDCAEVVKVIGENPTDNYKLVCKKLNLVVGGQYRLPFEICKFYEPTLPQNKKEYVSWEHYDDLLRNCEFNKECNHHKQSVHKTCSYEWYMNELVEVPISFKMGDKKVISAKVPRKTWIDHSFVFGDILKCRSLKFEPELTKTGKRKKNSIKGVAFSNIASVNMKTGEITDVLALPY